MHVYARFPVTGNGVKGGKGRITESRQDKPLEEIPQGLKNKQELLKRGRNNPIIFDG